MTGLREGELIALRWRDVDWTAGAIRVRRSHVRTALKAAGLEETHRFHDLRHTFGTRMAARGVPMWTLQEWMGHKDIATTQRYADYSPRHDERQLVQAAFADLAAAPHADGVPHRGGLTPAEAAVASPAPVTMSAQG